METDIFAEGALERIFKGEVAAQLKKDGTVSNWYARGFRYESDEATDAGCKVEEGARCSPDSRGVYQARVFVKGVERAPHLSSFFPQRMMRDEIISAVRQAYVTREALDEHKRRWRGEGGGLTIVLMTDEHERIEDVMPVKRRVNKTREAVYQFERTGKRSRRLCARCNEPKMLVCPRGHNTNLKPRVNLGHSLNWFRRYVLWRWYVFVGRREA